MDGLQHDVSKMSIIVTNFNRARNLDGCLRALARLKDAEHGGVEVIVCDDGSSDNSFEVVRAKPGGLRAKFCFHPSQGYRIAGARNAAARLAKGQWLLFLDSDDLASPQLIIEHLRSHSSRPDPQVVIGPVLTPRSPATQAVRHPHPAQHPWPEHPSASNLEDVRSGAWSDVGYQIDRMSEPWTMMMASNFSVRSDLFHDLGGFDEGIRGWGAEDTDLALRLHRRGARFVVNANAPVLHQKHSRQRTMAETYSENRAQLSRKYASSSSLTTELIPFYGMLSLERRLRQIRQLVRAQLAPNYLRNWDSKLKGWVKTWITGPSILVGGSEVALAEWLGVVAVQEPDARRLQQLSARLSQIRAGGHLGAYTPFKSREFKSAIITDSWRAFDPRISRQIVKETARTAQRVLLIHTPAYSVPMQAECSPIASASELSNQLTEHEGLGLRELLRTETTYLYEVVRQNQAV